MTGNRHSGISLRGIIVILAVSAFLLLVIGANIHLVKAAFESQPDCVVAGPSDEGGQGRYRVAKRSC